MILNYYQYRTDCSDLLIYRYQQYLITSHLLSTNRLQIQKGFQGDLNTLTFEQKLSISTRAGSDYSKAVQARAYENNGDLKSSINKWREIFGSDFPTFG